MEPIEIFFLIAALVLMILVFLVKEQRLNDPENSEMIFIDQLREACKLRHGPVSAVLVRQSGNLYRELGSFENPEAALEQILKSFRRAKIESVFLKKNTLDEFSVIRLHHSYGGSANGKKLGGALIVAKAGTSLNHSVLRVQDAEPSQLWNCLTDEVTGEVIVVWPAKLGESN